MTLYSQRRCCIPSCANLTGADDTAACLAHTGIETAPLKPMTPAEADIIVAKEQDQEQKVTRDAFVCTASKEILASRSWDRVMASLDREGMASSYRSRCTQAVMEAEFLRDVLVKKGYL